MSDILLLKVGHGSFLRKHFGLERRVFTLHPDFPNPVCQTGIIHLGPGAPTPHYGFKCDLFAAQSLSEPEVVTPGGVSDWELSPSLFARLMGKNMVAGEAGVILNKLYELRAFTNGLICVQKLREAIDNGWVNLDNMAVRKEEAERTTDDLLRVFLGRVAYEKSILVPKQERAAGFLNRVYAYFMQARLGSLRDDGEPPDF